MRKIVFIAEYEDGSKERFDIDRFTLGRGDHVARVVAGELQREPIWKERRLKPGNIVRVYRDPAISYLF